MAKEIVKDWDAQLEMKQRLKCEEEENDRMYAYLWIKDAENKVKLIKTISELYKDEKKHVFPSWHSCTELKYSLNCAHTWRT